MPKYLVHGTGCQVGRARRGLIGVCRGPDWEEGGADPARYSGREPTSRDSVSEVLKVNSGHNMLEEKPCTQLL